jgi:hypothetical protein
MIALRGKKVVKSGFAGVGGKKLGGRKPHGKKP